MCKAHNRLHKPSHLDKMLLTNPSAQVPLKCTCRSKDEVRVGFQPSVYLLDGNKETLLLASDKPAAKLIGFQVSNCDNKESMVVEGGYND